jgi:tetratricopeptide (TPR) repeat protein
VSAPSQVVESTVARIIRHEIVRLLILCGIAVLAFLFTRSVAARNRASQAQAATFWYQEGQAALRAGQGESALESFRRAAANEHNNRVYQFALAEALEASRQDEEARELLMRLREATPEDPSINLHLARLLARKNDVATATRYYHNAIYGVWAEETSESERQAIRLELARFLLAHSNRGLALSELLAFSRALPENPAAYSEVGNLFLEAGDSARALAHFQHALKLAPQRSDALLGAGKAAFQMGDYAHARDYLGALGPGPEAEQAQPELEIAELVLANDPLTRGLAPEERSKRVLTLFNRALERAQACAPSLEEGSSRLPELLPQAQALQPSLRPYKLARDSELASSTLKLAYEMQEETNRSCGVPSALDRALLAIGAKYFRSLER